MVQIDPANRSLEIGYTWLAAEHRDTCVNPEAKLLMLNHAFAADCARYRALKLWKLKPGNKG